VEEVAQVAAYSDLLGFDPSNLLEAPSAKTESAATAVAALPKAAPKVAEISATATQAGSL